MMMDRAVSWPNLLSLLRLLSAPLIGFFIYQGDLPWALGMFVFASLTDVLDGLWARLSGNISRLGIYLDPIADKILLLVSYGMLGKEGFLPLWVSIFVILRDMIIFWGAFYLYRDGKEGEIRPLIWGKLNTFSQIFLVLVTLGKEVFLPSGGSSFLISDFLTVDYVSVFQLWVFLLFLTAALGMISLCLYGRMYIGIQSPKNP